MRTVFLFAAMALLADAGCYTSSRGEALEKRLEALTSRHQQSTRQADAARRKLAASQTASTEELRKASAELNAHVERLQRGVVIIKDQVATLTRTLNTTLAGLAPKRKRTNKTLPPAQLFSRGRQLIAEGQHLKGRKLLRTLLATAPGDANAAEAQTLLGDSYYQQLKLVHSGVEYAKVISTYPNAKAQLARAYFGIGMGYYQRKQCREGRSFLRTFVRRFKRHAKRGDAQKAIRRMWRYRRNQTICER